MMSDDCFKEFKVWHDDYIKDSLIDQLYINSEYGDAFESLSDDEISTLQDKFELDNNLESAISEIKRLTA